MKEYKFEEEETWRLTRGLAWEIYELTSSGSFGDDHQTRNNIRRASFAIMANVAEGFERGGTSEFNHYLSNAKDELIELRVQLNSAVRQGYVANETVVKLETFIEELGCMISSLMTSLSQAFIDVDVVGEYF
jgi:four helix bundle protein